jgi:AraC family transcriptional regulator
MEIAEIVILGEMRLFIKNMVCPRCIAAVESTLKNLGMNSIFVRLGEVLLEQPPSPGDLAELDKRLQSQGFELLDDSRRRQIEQMKTLIIERIRDASNATRSEKQGPLSELLSRRLHREYSQLSKLFSETEGITVEQFAILQRIEKVKELLTYDEWSLSQIADRLDYSSVAHLSAQFKKVTGLTPTQFKAQGIRRPLDNLGA